MLRVDVQAEDSWTDVFIGGTPADLRELDAALESTLRGDRTNTLTVLSRNVASELAVHLSAPGGWHPLSFRTENLVLVSGDAEAFHELRAALNSCLINAARLGPQPGIHTHVQLLNPHAEEDPTVIGDITVACEGAA